MKFSVSYGKRKHCGGLKESLETSVGISRIEFEQLCSRFHFYAFDDRVDQIMFLANDLEKEEYHWLYIQLNLVVPKISVYPGEQLHLDITCDLSKKIDVDSSILEKVATDAIRDYLNSIGYVHSCD